MMLDAVFASQFADYDVRVKIFFEKKVVAE